MKRTSLFLTTGLMCQAALFAQTQTRVLDYQQSYTQTVDALAGGRSGGRALAMPLPRQEMGKPFSATVTTTTTQTFLDGTHVSQSSTILEFRDAEGRVRTENTRYAQGSSETVKIITIRDPVAGVTYTLDPANRSATKLPMAGMTATVLPRSPIPGEAGGGRMGGGRNASTPPPGMQPPDAAPVLRQIPGTGQAQGDLQAVRSNPNDIVEDLGTAQINGVAARGTRITNVVPVGAIGNDREFRSVTERWFSSELNLLIKSVSTDPRFGTTTYELTNISRQAPDPSLFQVPADYSITGPGGGR